MFPSVLPYKKKLQARRQIIIPMGIDKEMSACMGITMYLRDDTKILSTVLVLVPDPLTRSP